MARLFQKNAATQIVLSGHPVLTSLDGAASVTMAAWVRVLGTLGTGSDDNRVFFAVLDGINTGLQLSVRSTRVVRVRTRPEAADSLIAQDSTATIPDNTQWHLIGATIDYAAKTITPYVNGVASNQLSSIAWTANALTLGTPSHDERISGDEGNTTARKFPGAVGWMAFFRGTLTSTEWDALLAGTRPNQLALPSGVTLGAYLPLDESGPVVTETVGNTTHLANGAPLDWYPDPFLVPVSDTLSRALAVDTFAGTADSDLADHTSDSGATWTYHPASTEATGLQLTGSGALKSVHTEAGTNRAYLSVPQTSKQVRIAFDVNVTGTVAASRNVEVFARFSDTTEDGVTAHYSGGGGGWRIRRVIAGVATNVATVDIPLASGTSSVEVAIGFRDIIIAVNGKTILYGRNAVNDGIDRFGVVGVAIGHDAAGTAPYEVSDLRITQGPISWDIAYGSDAVAGSTYQTIHLPTILDAGDYVLAFAEGRYGTLDSARKDIICARALKADLLAGTADPWSALITVDGTGGSANELNHNPIPVLLSNGDIEVYYFNYESGTTFTTPSAGDCLIYRRTSTDNGATWSARTDVTTLFTSDTPHRITLGPGPAIRLPSGRTLIVFTQAVGGEDLANRQTRVAYRDTDAAAWTTTASINTARVESALASLGGSRVALNQRDVSGDAITRVFTFSEDGGATWGESAAIQPPTQPSRDTSTGNHQGLSAGWSDGQAIAVGATDTTRKRLGLWWTDDYGVTWTGQADTPETPYPGGLIDDGLSCYANAIPLGDDYLAISWTGGANSTIMDDASPSGGTPDTLQRWSVGLAPRSLTGLSSASASRRRRRSSAQRIAAARNVLLFETS